MSGKNEQQGNPQLVTNTNNGNGADVFIDPVTGQALMLTTSSGIDCLCVWDDLGSPVGLLTDFATNAFSQGYDPYVVPAFTVGGSGDGTAKNPYAFKAGITDRAPGLVQFGIRYYEARSGTWILHDGLNKSFDSTNDNRPTCAASDPMDGRDRSGHSYCAGTDEIAIGAGAFARGAQGYASFTAPASRSKHSLG